MCLVHFLSPIHTNKVAFKPQNSLIGISNKGKGKGKSTKATEVHEELAPTGYSFTTVQSLNIGSFAVNKLIHDIKPR